MTSAYDVAVVGAGLAGSTVAIHLARAGHRVKLIEAKRFPRDKVCGEFLSPDALASLSRLGVLGSLNARGAVPIRSIAVTAGVSWWRATLPSAGLGLSRASLDTLLFEVAATAGADVEDGVTVRDIERQSEQRFRLCIARADDLDELTARCVVGAFGRRSAVDRDDVGGAGNVGFKGHYTGIELGEELELHAFPGGYCGLASVEGGRVNLCLQVSAKSLREVGGTFDSLCERSLMKNPALAHRLSHLRLVGDRVLAVAGLGSRTRRADRGGVVCVGDAAATITPLCGDGMAMALRSAEILAPQVAAHLRGERTRDEATVAYARACEREFRRRLWVGRVIEKALVRPRVASALLQLLRVAPTIGDSLIRSTRG